MGLSEIEILMHMVGNNGTQQAPGWRNYYCASVDSDEYKTLERLEAQGYVYAGPYINQGRDRYWYTTKEGMRVGCGLSK